jgi:hypothetical protein
MSGANLSMNIVHTVLEEYERRFGRLPSRIRLQLDNTGKYWKYTAHAINNMS